MKHLPGLFIFTGLLILIVALWELWRLGDGLPEESCMCGWSWRGEMDTDMLKGRNGRDGWIEIPGRVDGR